MGDTLDENAANVGLGSLPPVAELTIPLAFSLSPTVDPEVA
jgi:hypothetical protein